MTVKIPFTFSSVDKLKKRSVPFKKIVHPRKSKLGERLAQTDFNLSREDYLSIIYRNAFLNFAVLLVLSSTFFLLLRARNGVLLALGFSFLFTLFVTFSQLAYPKVYNNRRQKEIEKNLIPALQDMLVQLHSGIPLYSILINISASDYGELSKEFSKAVRKINAGLPQVEVLEDIGENNPSLFFRRTLWQISNGMRAGSDIAIVIEDSVKSLNEEQIIQIQTYGNKLNPIIMFYMLISVIIPALSITFLTIISSLVDLPSTMTKLLFIGVFVFVTIIQIMFLGILKSIRPSLL